MSATMLVGASEWWFALTELTRAGLRVNAHLPLSGVSLEDIRQSQQAGPGSWVAATYEEDEWRLTASASQWVEVMTALTITVRGLTAWDRRSDARDQISPMHSLLSALTGIGSLAERLQLEPAWQLVLADPDQNGRTLTELLDGYWWARAAPGGLREAAQLYGTESSHTAIWQRDTWWFTTAELDPTFGATLAGRPATDVIRAVLAGFARIYDRTTDHPRTA